MTIRDELLALRRDDGSLHAPDVVEWSRDNPGSTLYRQFTWDDAKAAAKWRLSEARRLIAVYVTDATGERTTISLMPDRVGGNGYRDLGSVMSNSEMRLVALKQAQAEFERAANRYLHLTEFEPVRESIGRTRSVIDRLAASISRGSEAA